MAVRWVHRFGASLPVFLAADGLPLDGVVRGLQSGPGIVSPVGLTVSHGLAYDASGNLIAFPEVGEYVVTNGTVSTRVDVPVATAFTRIGLASSGSIRVFHDPEVVTLTVHPAQATYPAKHKQTQAKYDKSLTVCGTCEKFAFVRQEDLESAPIQTVTTDPDQAGTLVPGLPPAATWWPATRTRASS